MDTNYTQQLNTIIVRLNDLISSMIDLKSINDLLFLVLAIFLVIYVMRGE